MGLGVLILLGILLGILLPGVSLVLLGPSCRKGRLVRRFSLEIGLGVLTCLDMRLGVLDPGVELGLMDTSRLLVLILGVPLRGVGQTQDLLAGVTERLRRVLAMFSLGRGFILRCLVGVIMILSRPAASPSAWSLLITKRAFLDRGVTMKVSSGPRLPLAATLTIEEYTSWLSAKVLTFPLISLSNFSVSLTLTSFFLDVGVRLAWIGESLFTVKLILNLGVLLRTALALSIPGLVALSSLFNIGLAPLLLSEISTNDFTETLINPELLGELTQ